MDHYTLITGSSSGLGLEMARKCATLNRNVLLVSLPNENLAQIALEISTEFNVQTDFFEGDLTLDTTISDIHSWVIKNGYDINFLINNAGFGGVGSFDSYSLAYVNTMLDLNIKSVTQLTHTFIPELKKNSPSHILNVASMAANFPFPYKSIYAASKAYVRNFSLALHEELKPFQISVTTLQPGAIPTNEVVKNQLKTGGFLARTSTISPEDVAHTAIIGALAHKKIITPGFKNRVSLFVMKLIPTSISLRLLGKQGRKMIANSTK